jgi:hypothetical protein
VPVPLRATTDVLPLVELLLIVIWPDCVPVVVGRNRSCSVNDWVGFRITGKLPPRSANPAPETMAEFTVNGEVPVDVSVRVFDINVPTAPLPKSRLPGLIVNCGFAAVPVPLRAIMTMLLPVELLLIVTCPLAEPVDIGLNSTCNVIDCVGFSVVGKLCPRIVNPVPLIDIEFTVTGEVPVDLRVSACVAAAFTITLPKFNLTGLTANSGFSAAVPAPLREITAVPPIDELLLIVNWPLANPVDAGSNCT